MKNKTPLYVRKNKKVKQLVQKYTITTAPAAVIMAMIVYGD